MTPNIEIPAGAPALSPVVQRRAKRLSGRFYANIPPPKPSRHCTRRVTTPAGLPEGEGGLLGLRSDPANNWAIFSQPCVVESPLRFLYS
jgi:hypothetical protein